MIKIASPEKTSLANILEEEDDENGLEEDEELEKMSKVKSISKMSRG